MTISAIEKLQTLLRDLFQFDSAGDLDFGIYRIMNQKRTEAERFIDERLIEIVDGALSSGVAARQADLARELQEKAEQVRNTLGTEAISPGGELDPQWSGTNIGREYLDLRSRAGGAPDQERLKASIFNHLYTFFSRYYEGGDFLSRKRYSRRQKYAIPYNGEEVYLHWANADQYYVKTGEHFLDYSYTKNGVTVCFEVAAADVEHNDVKDDNRRFVPRLKEAAYDAETKTLTVPFEWRPLSAKEQDGYGKRQADIDGRVVKEILDCFGKEPEALAALETEKRKNSKGESVSHLEHHLRRYTAKNTSDFFIHKDLKGFLEGELDFYLKNEVLNIDDLESWGEENAEGWFEVMRAMKRIGREIVAFLAQIEDFQKRLFEKKKFVARSDYCLTLDRIPEEVRDELYGEILENGEQFEEWERLFIISEVPDNLENGGDARTVAWLEANPHLVLDTKFFDEDFKDRLLSGIEDLDEQTDGLLIRSENFQALNLLQERYREQVKCIYIDPPYNSKTSEILYKNDYKHSSWLSLMENRLLEARKLQHPESVLVVAIDENEQEKLGMYLGSLFPEHSKTCVTVIHNPGGIQGTNFSYSHEYAYFVFPPNGKYIGTTRREEADIVPLRDWGGNESKRETAKNCFYPVFVEGGNVTGFGDVCPDDFHPGQAVFEQEDGTTTVYPVDSSGVERKWRFARQSVENIKNDLVCEEVNGEKVIRRHKSEYRYKTVWTDKKYNSNSYGSKLLRNILGTNEFAFPKSVYTVAESIHATTQGENSPYILDYFAGSGTTGHAVINLNREDGGERKYILVEMGNYFDTVLKPRIQKVIYSKDWRDGRPTSRDTGASYMFKYVTLEQYEDTLNNIAFTHEKEGTQAMELYGDEYLLRYVLDFETRDSETLLNVEKMSAPFRYTLTLRDSEAMREMPVDLPETFAYLLGMRVKSRKTYHDGDRRYLIYRGPTRERDDVAVIWRHTEGWNKEDYERDRRFVEERAMAEGAKDVFVNGDALIPDARPLEATFEKLMLAGSAAERV